MYWDCKSENPMTANNIPRYNDQITYMQRIRCIKIVHQKQKIVTNCISHLRMARRDQNMFWVWKRNKKSEYIKSLIYKYLWEH
jgi:hypothetical protein